MNATSANQQLITQGYCVLPSVFEGAMVARFRDAVLGSLDMMGKTRNIEHSRHLAGFHRFPQLTTLHSELVSNPAVNSFLQSYFKASPYYAIGLSDITINRSQEWHTDLLRGKFGSFLPEGLAWKVSHPGCLKALVYLQPGKSLRIVPGSHLSPTPLDDRELDKLAQASEHVQLELNAGDVVMMDIRALHRGSTVDQMSDPELALNPKILVSTVFGPIGSGFAQAMQLGNAHRLMEWDQRYLA